MSYSDYFDTESLKKLVEKFKQDPDKSQYTEQDVKTKYILPLIEILGWDIHSLDQVKEESPAGVGFVDISLRIYSIPKILVEAKKFGTLDGTRQRRGRTITWEEQTLEYSYSLQTDWCILTNFEEFRLFFTPAATPTKAKIITLNFENYLSNTGLEIFKYISFNGVLEGIINRLAKKRERRPIDIEIAADLLISNLEIFKILNKKYSLEYSEEELKHFTQRFIERLLVLRAAEDWELLRADQIKDLFDSWKRLTLDKEIEPFSQRMSSLYLQFNKRFNTAIFAPSPVDDLKLSDEVYERVITRLYKYNFDKIDADVLGNVYEEYLGHILKEKEGKYTLTENYLNKQKYGIYYTKSYIVKYIITKTFLNKIKDIQSQENLKNLKLIDISCGSGTFLVESFNVLENRYSKVRESENNSANTGTLDSWLAPRFNWKNILTNNIFGIDIDLFATEIASVNLALRSITKTEKLPLILDENIFCKNSLFYDYNPILGESEGFDFVVGNPPYVLGDNLEEEEKQKLSDDYSEIYKAEADYCFYFIKKGIDLLKEGGRLGFIVARYFMKAKYGLDLRNYILQNCKILEIIDFGNIDVFEGIGSRCCIFILEKISDIPDSHNIQVINVTSRKIKISKERIFIEILNLENAIQDTLEGETSNLEGFFKAQSELTSDPWILTLPKKEEIYNKCKNNFSSLKDLDFRVGQGGICGLESVFRVSSVFLNSNSLEMELWKPDVKTKDIRAYNIGQIEDYIFYGENIDDFQEFDTYPNTKKYLLDNLSELAFGRLDFQVDNKFNRKENNLLKIIGQKSFEGDYMNINDLEIEIKKIHKKRKTEESEDYENIIIDIKEKFKGIDIFDIYNDEIHIDCNSIEFHNFWNWWKWTSPRNIDLFGNIKILTPYISENNNFMIDYDNRFSVSAAVIGLAYPLNEEKPDYNFLLGLLNSRLYTFIHQIRAKPKDYRFEYFIEALEELPFPVEINSSQKTEISTYVKKLLDLMNLRNNIEDAFIQVLQNNNALEKKINFEIIWNNLTKIGIKRIRITPGDPIMESIAFKNELINNEFVLKYFSIEEQKWVSCLKLEVEEEKSDYLEFQYLLFNLFLKENQIASRTSWRKGQLFSDIILKKIQFYCPKNLSGINYLQNFPTLLEEIKVNIGSSYLDISSIDNEIIKLEQKINEKIYEIFELDSEERKIIENDIKFDIPYLP